MSLLVHLLMLVIVIGIVCGLVGWWADSVAMKADLTGDPARDAETLKLLLQREGDES